MRSPALAIAWEIWARHRIGLIFVLAILLAGPLLISLLQAAYPSAGFANPVAYTLTAVALLVTFGCFHFTEGSKKGGFGCFPTRLFNLPTNTWLLVGLPMVYGAGAMVVVFLLSATALLGRVVTDLPLLWPSLYLVFGLSQFQMIIWSLPKSRYLKLLCLSIAAAVITFGWMFFAPTIVAGALSEWGYQGDPAVFVRRLLLVLVLTGPTAYVISLRCVSRQRHGLIARTRGLPAWFEHSLGRFFRCPERFCSADHAIFWQEFRRTGCVLPTAILIIVALTCVPACLSGGLDGRATMSILSWLFLSPFLFAMIIGRGFGKPDFWSTSLKLTTFNAILPLTPGQWVGAKLKVALMSSALTWAWTLYLGFLWTAWVGDLERLAVWRSRFLFYYTPAECWLMLALALPAAVIVTWRFLVASLAAGLSGRKVWYHLVNLLITTCLLTLFVLTIRQSDDFDRSLRFHQIWPAISWLPAVLMIAAIAKFSLGTLAWDQAIHRGMATPRSAACYVTCWLLAVSVLATLAFIACRNIIWLRHLLMLTAILIVPLAGPAVAMRSLAGNRSRP